jgi:signal transduction histidine kinase/DNA-binding NarL/FixJ family response regulator
MLAGFLLLASILPLVTLGLISDNVSRSVIGQDTTDYNWALVNAQRDYLDVLFQEIESLIINISGVDQIKATIDDATASPDEFTRLATQAQIGYILSGYSGVKGLVSLDIFTPGNAHYHVGDTLNVQDINRPLLARLQADAAAADSLVAWLGLEENVNSNSTHKKVITAAKLLRIFDTASLQEKLGALLLVNFSTEDLYDHFAQLDIGPGAYFIVIDGQGRLVYHPNRDLIGSPVSTAFQNRLIKGSVIMEVDGQEMLVTGTSSNVNDWQVISLVPYSNVTSSADMIRRVALVVVIVSFAFIALIVWIVSRIVVRPLTRLTESFQQIQNSTFNWRVRLPETRTDEIGELTRWFNIFLDSMEAKQQAERDLVQAKEAAEAANRAKSVFLANMSHELRTPLNAILGFSELMANDETLTAAQRANLETINRSGEHLLGLINDILDLSKIESGRADVRPHHFDLHRLLHGLQEMFEIRARQKNLRLIVTWTPEVPRYLHLDEGKLRQVLINLLGNAIKFTRTGTVALSVSLAAPDGEPQTIDRLHFAVEDTGIGIAPEDLEHIFEPFAQSQARPAAQDGTGLGLAISRQQVELLGGQLTIKSEVGSGSTFSFDIPLTPGRAEEAATTQDRVTGLAPGQAATDGSPFRLLIAEDVAANRRFLVELLRPLGFRVREAVDGEEALAIWKTWQPHLIFMDLRLPRLSGLAVTRRIKATPQGQRTAIVMITASAFEEDRTAALTQGCDGFIHKPVRGSQIFEVLQDQLGVEFLYAPGGDTALPARRVAPTDPAQIPPLSAAWKDNLRRAVHEADAARMQELIQETAADYPEFSAALLELVYHFDYASLAQLIDEV